MPTTPRVWTERERIAHMQAYVSVLNAAVKELRNSPLPQFGYSYIVIDIMEIQARVDSLLVSLGTAASVEDGQQ